MMLDAFIWWVAGAGMMACFSQLIFLMIIVSREKPVSYHVHLYGREETKASQQWLVSNRLISTDDN